jgi:hypothetical protein
MPSATLERILNEVKRLTPEERRELREALEREAVCAVVLPSAGVDNDRWERERRWLDEHREQYLGQWVALEGDRLLASGAGRAGRLRVGARGRPRPFGDARRAARRVAVRGVVRGPQELSSFTRNTPTRPKT